MSRHHARPYQDDSKEPDETEIQNVESSKEKKEKDSEGESKGVTRTVLLTVPLFCKFVVVLLLKFVTDLIVFPLLFLYRLAGIGKRRFFKMIGKESDTREKTNGET